MPQDIPSSPVPVISKPFVIVVMGVSGCGKSTLAEALAAKLGIEMFDADDFHPAENVAHMAEGKPLSDAMRAPWVEALRAHLKSQIAAARPCTLAFSGLRREHRERLRIAPSQVLFFHLVGSKELIWQRMNARQGHFMPASLLDSQFATLEATDSESDVIPLDVSQPITELVATALGHLSQKP